MAIEFRCGQCGKLLRTGDDTGGKRAKCPSCGTILMVPAPERADSAPAVPPPPPLPGDVSQTPAPGYAQGPYAAPSPPPGPPPELPPGGLTPIPIGINDIFDSTWAIFQQQWATCIGSSLLSGLLTAGAVLAVWAVAAMGGAILTAFRPPGAMGLGLPGVLLFLLACVGSILSVFWLQIGLVRTFLRIARGQDVAMAELFTGGPFSLRRRFRHLWRALAAAILVNLLVAAGYLLLIVPGVILGLMLSQFFYLILDQNAGVFDAMKLSVEVTEGSKLTLFLVWLVASIVGSLVILLTCGLGGIAVGPYLLLMSAVIYLRMTGQPIAEKRG